MTMLEKAAKAHYEASHDMRVELAWEACHPDYRAQKITAMAAAITALMVPSTASLDAGVACALNITVAGEGGWTKYVTTLHRAMLKAALAEE